MISKMKELKGMILRTKELRGPLGAKAWETSHLKKYKTEVGES